MRTFFKNLLAVIIGYLGIALIIMVSFSIAYMILGAEGSYQSNSWNVSTTWIILSIGLGFVSAWIGGKICISIARNHVAPKYLVALILMFGILSIMNADHESIDTVRSISPSIMEAMNNSIQPLWLSYLNPGLGVLGVIIGSGLLRIDFLKSKN